MQYGVRLTANLGSKESLTSALRGMGDVDPAAEGGAFFNYSLPQGLFLTSSARYGAGVDNKRLVVDLGAGYLALPSFLRCAENLMGTQHTNEYKLKSLLLENATV